MLAAHRALLGLFLAGIERTPRIKMRSRLLKSLISLGAMLVAVASASAAAPQVLTQAPGFYRVMVGEFEVTALLDGTHPFPDAEVLTKAEPGANVRSKLFEDNLAEANALLSATDQKAPTERSINAFLINTGTKLVLIDSGAGALYGGCCGHLLENLRAAGYLPEQVDEILLTHLHADHIGGIAPGGVIAYSSNLKLPAKHSAQYS